MPTHILYLVTYDRGTYPLTGKIKPHHWSYFIQTEAEAGKNWGIAHQLRGMPGGFYYPGPEEMDLETTGPRKEELEVGEVDMSKADKVHEILKQLRTDSSESSGWNCQDWALDGFDKLKDEGFIYHHLTPEAIKSWLKET